MPQPSGDPADKDRKQAKTDDPNYEGGSLDRKDDERGSNVPEHPGVQQPPIRGSYGTQSAGQGFYRPDSREGGEWRDESQGQTSGQQTGSGYQDSRPQAPNGGKTNKPAPADTLEKEKH